MPYPYTFPSIAPREIEFQSRSTVAKFTSPFTKRSQLVNFNGGQWWELNLQFPPLFDANAKTLSGFVNSLQGQYGTFYYTLPASMRISGSVTFTVSGNGNEITVTSGTAQPGLFGASLGNPRRLVQFTTATSIFPALPGGTSVTLHPTTGSLFRLASNDNSFSVNEIRQYGVSLPIVEAI
jgi:hypothetical protein